MRHHCRGVRSRVLPFALAILALSGGAAAAPPRDGNIQGTVTDAETGAPLGGVPVVMTTAWGYRLWSGTTDGSGRYATASFASSGSPYYLHTEIPLGVGSPYTNLAYGGVPCTARSCPLGTGVTLVDGTTTSGIDFALREGGAIAGRVTAADTGLGLPTAKVTLLDNGKIFIGSFTVQADGSYAIGALPDGTYYAQVCPAPDGYLGQHYSGVTVAWPCGGSLPTDTPIVVSGAATAGGIDFALVRGGRISGTVRARATGLPLANVVVTVYRSDGFQLTSVHTDQAGGYATALGLTAGTYFLHAYAPTEYLEQTYDRIDCGFDCPPVTTGTPVAVDLGATASGIDFALARGGAIRGRVTDRLTGVPLAGIVVSVVPQVGGGHYFSLTTGADGTYATTEPLPAGGYYVWAASTSSYFGSVYDGLDCGTLSCPSLWLGTPVTVANDSVTEGIDLRLLPSSTISGRVTAATSGVPLAGVTVELYSATGSFLRALTTGTDGSYRTNFLLATGTYYLATDNSSGYLDQLYQGVNCERYCPSATTGTPVVVAPGASVGSIDFGFLRGGGLTGTVRTAAEGVPMAGVRVSIYPCSGSSGAEATTDANGVYSFSLPLWTGSYYVAASGPAGYLGQLYSGVDYGGSSTLRLASGKAVAVTAEQTTAGIDFSLVRAGVIRGAVREAGTRAPLSGARVWVYGEGLGYSISATSGADGSYAATLPFLSGVYYLCAEEPGRHLAQLFNNREAGKSCPYWFTAGTPVRLVPATTVTGIDFSLSEGASIGGTVRAAATGLALAGASVSLYDSSGSLVSTLSSDAAGVYRASPLPPGSYYLRASATGYLRQQFDGVVCGLVCPPVTTSAPVVVTAGTSRQGVDFALPTSAKIQGVVTAADTGAPVYYVPVSLFDAAGRSVGSISTDGVGAYRTTQALPAGTYFLSVQAQSPFASQVYSGIDCGASCPPATTGTGVSVADGATATADFQLARLPSITGVVAAAGGPPVLNATVVAYRANGSSVASGSTAADGSFRVLLAPGVYYLVASASSYSAQLYSGVNCGESCAPFVGGTAVTVPAVGEVSGVDFALSPRSEITGTVRAADGGAPLAGVSVDVITGSGLSSSSGTTDSSGVYRVTVAHGIGRYYVKASRSDPYLSQFYGGFDCADGACPPTGGIGVELAVGATVSGIDFSVNRGGTIAGRVTDAATGNPVGGIRVDAYDGALRYVASATSGADGSYSLANRFTSGSYYVESSPTSSYLAHLYGGPDCFVSCPSADTGAPVAVTAGDVTAGIDFALVRGGRIAGTITETPGGLPISGARVQVYSATGGSASYYPVSTNSAGTYLSDRPLESGSYYVTAVADGYAARAYGGASATAALETAGAVTVSAGEVTTGIDIALARGGRVSGVVLEAASGLPIPGVSVRVYDAKGRSVATATSNGHGEWFTSLETGTYYAVTSNTAGYVDQRYKGAECLMSSCAPVEGTPVLVTAPHETRGISFLLVKGGGFSGVVSSAATGGPVAAKVYAFDSAGRRLGSVATNAEGVYTWYGLPAGPYYVSTSNQVGHLDQLYPGLECPAWSCDVTTGSRVTVTAGATTAGVSFVLRKGGGITGYVRATTGGGIQEVPILIYNESSVLVSDVPTSAYQGYYQSGAGLPTGTYYVRTNSAPYRSTTSRNQAYQGVDCPDDCPPIAGWTPVAVTAPGVTEGIDFALTAAGSIAGTVRASGGAGLYNVKVEVLNQAGTVVASTTTPTGGAFTTPRLPDGDYYVRTVNARGFVDRIYPGSPCPGGSCGVAGGAPVTVSAGQVTSGIDFVLERGGTVAGSVRSLAGGRPLGGVTVTAYDAAGSAVGTGRTLGAGEYFIATGLPSGTCFLKATGAAGHLDQVYSALPGATAVTSGTPVTVVSPERTAGIDFTLAPAVPSFDDEPLVAGVTPVKLAHVAALREAIDTLRALHGLAPFTWTDGALVRQVSPAKAVHLEELRAALGDVYEALGRGRPAFSDAPAVGGRTVITAANVLELRAAIVAIW